MHGDKVAASGAPQRFPQRGRHTRVTDGRGTGGPHHFQPCWRVTFRQQTSLRVQSDVLTALLISPVKAVDQRPFDLQSPTTVFMAFVTMFPVQPFTSTYHAAFIVSSVPRSRCPRCAREWDLIGQVVKRRPRGLKHRPRGSNAPTYRHLPDFSVSAAAAPSRHLCARTLRTLRRRRPVAKDDVADTLLGVFLLSGHVAPHFTWLWFEAARPINNALMPARAS